MNPDDILNDADTMRMNTKFFIIINNVVGLSKADKGRYIRSFESLEMLEKEAFLEELFKADGSTKRRDLLQYWFKGAEGPPLSNVETNKYNQQITNDAVVEEQVKKPEQPKVTNAMEELEKLIGLKAVKDQVKALIAFIEMSKLRQQQGLKSKSHVLHMMFKGNPGTGKTTVARLLGQIFKEIGVLEKGHVIEIDRANLISKYQGEIEQKITQYVAEAQGGILFIDEIYSLYKQGDNNDQGKQGVEVLLKAIEDKGTSFICIGAGYNEEVDTFLSSNPGLPSRFPIQIQFEDYTEDELVSIAIEMFKGQDYNMDKGFEEEFRKVIAEEMENETFGNGRVVRNIIESSIREQSLRLWNDKSISKTRDVLMSIVKEDFKYVPLKLKPKEEEKSDIQRLTELLENKNKKPRKGQAS